MTWNATDRRKINPQTRDYVLDSDGFDVMNSVSQRVYFALSKVIPNDRKKTANIDERTKAAIENALSSLLESNLISNVVVRVDKSKTARLAILIEYRNETLQRTEAVSFS